MSGENAPQVCNADIQSGDSDIFFVNLSFKGTTYGIPVQVGEQVSSIFDFVQEVLPEFPRENCRLIHRGKQLRPNDDVTMSGENGLAPGAKLMLLASTGHDVALVKNLKADPLVKGFEAEERDERNRKKRANAGSHGAWGTKQDPEYCFGSIKAEFKYNTPSPYEAEALLKKLATDPGVIEIMKTHSFKVGILTEMSPAEAQERMAKRGTPGMDLLGYNQNNGDMIVLKLRTDNTKGFRPYHDLIGTLLHELTHNVISPHDQRFWKLYGELTAQYKKFHRFWSQGGKSVNGETGGQFAGFTDSVEDANSSGFGHILGGVGVSGHGMPTTLAPADLRERRAAAAQKRMAETFDFTSGTGGKFVCACGLVHDLEETCGFSDAPISTEAATDNAPMESNDFQPQPMPSEIETQMDVEPMLPEFVEPMEIEVPLLVDPKLPEPVELMQNEVPLLDVDELAALGLDGAAQWVQSFEGQLRSMGRSAESKNMAELLLRLVQNIIDRPNEAKFRRIRAENPRIRSALLSLGPVAESLLVKLGFESVMDADGQVFTMRDAAVDVVRLRLGKDLLEQIAVH